LKRFEIQREETERRNAQLKPAVAGDDPQFSADIGAVVAKLVREAKPGAGPLSLSTNLELDLGFDSLARVELFSLAEAQLGAAIEESEAARIFTLGELIDALARSQNAEAARGRNWGEILKSAPDDELRRIEIFNQFKATRFAAYLMIKIVKFGSMALFGMSVKGLEKLPRETPFLICPNHESFLDGPLVISILPRRIVDRIFTLGYTDYWEGPFMSRLARFCNIVPIDPNVNLVRAMQIGAFGLKNGRVLVVFPEGTRTIDGHIGEMKKGAAILACEMNTPVVPVGIRGAYEMWPRGGNFRLHPVEFVFGDPIYPQSFAGAPDPYTALTEALKEKLKELSGDI
jgi:long-chain acyl-CoA synthetase